MIQHDIFSLFFYLQVVTTWLIETRVATSALTTPVVEPTIMGKERIRGKDWGESGLAIPTRAGA